MNEFSHSFAFFITYVNCISLHSFPKSVKSVRSVSYKGI